MKALVYVLVDLITNQMFVFNGVNQEDLKRLIVNWLMTYAEKVKTFKPDDWQIVPLGELSREDKTDGVWFERSGLKGFSSELWLKDFFGKNDEVQL